MFKQKIKNLNETISEAKPASQEETRFVFECKLADCIPSTPPASSSAQERENVLEIDEGSNEKDEHSLKSSYEIELPKGYLPLHFRYRYGLGQLSNQVIWVPYSICVCV